MTLDPISGALIGAGAKEVLTPTRLAVGGLTRKAYDSLAVKFENCFQGHLEATYRKCSQIKNLLYRDEAADFRSKYVWVQFSHGKELKHDAAVLEAALSGQKVLISGTAGAGKTMFMRWAALGLIDGVHSHRKVPLYLEMRYTPRQFGKASFEEYLYDSTSAIRDKSSFGQFIIGLRAGLFVILLDAIDEISPDIRSEVVLSIIKFSQSYPECSLIMSSRPDDSLSSVQALSVYKTVPMTLPQIKEVIHKLDWNEEVKGKLVERLDGGLYERLSEFLSNPLLATIMLLTFDVSADIPSRLTSFYQQAFEVLYQRHDATKGAFKRELHADLQIGAFQELFSAFSFQTYVDYKFEFTDSQLRSAFVEAIEYLGISVNPDDVIKDSMEAACLIQKEGLDNVFVHRSFQDYFCALFIANYKEDDVKSLIDSIASNETRSNALKMLYELSPETFDYEWLLPHFEEFLAEFKRINPRTKSGLTKFLKGHSDGIYVGVESGEVEYLTWGVGREGFFSRYDRWMAAAEAAMSNRSLGRREIFSEPIWGNFREFIDTLPADVRPFVDEEERIELSPFAGEDDDPVKTIGLSFRDARWLIHSRLPERFLALRAAVASKRDEILARREQRRLTVKRLLERRRGSD